MGAKDFTLGTFKVLDATQGMNANKSDGRYEMDGTWADKIEMHGEPEEEGDSYVLGEVHAGTEERDLDKVPRDTKCHAVVIPSLQVLRWAVTTEMKDTLGGERHDYLNRGDAIADNENASLETEQKPHRGYITVKEDGTVKVSSS